MNIKMGIVTLSNGYLGDAVRINKFEQVLTENGFQVKLFNPYNSMLPLRKKNGKNVPRLTTLIPSAWKVVSSIPGVKNYAVELLSYKTLVLTLSNKLFRLVKGEDLDLLQAETWFAADVALPVAKKLGIPMVLDIHSGSCLEEIKNTVGPSPGFTKYWAERESIILKNSEYIIVTSKGMKDNLESMHHFCNVYLAPSGSDPWDTPRSGFSSPLKVIYAGIFAYWERVHDFLDAAKLLQSDDFKFYLAGDGYQKKELLEKIQRENIPVTYIGYLPRAELRQLLATMHIGVVPMAMEKDRKYCSSIKTYEYLSMGLPVVCADVGEWANAVRAGQCGHVVRAEDPVALANGIRSYKDKALWERHSHNGINFIKESCSWEHIIGELIPMYETVAKRA